MNLDDIIEYDDEGTKLDFKKEEYKLITSQNILLNKNKNKKKYHRNKSSDHWVDRLYKQDTQKRKMERYCLDTAFVSGYKRVPLPPAKIIPFIFSPPV